MTKVTNIPGRLHSVELGNIVAGANEIYDDTKGKKQNVINSEADAELLRLEQSKQDNLTFDNVPTENSNNPVKSGGVYAADLALQQAIEAILLLIPSAATALNQLADKNFVNSSISTATATFRGTYNVVTDLHLAVDATHAQIEAALASVVATADNNDYCYVQIPVSSSSQDIQKTSRYKFNGSAWVFEYDLNTSGFTAEQWAAINSGITLALVGKLDALPTAVELAEQLAAKQNVLTFDDAPTQGSNNPVKSGGIYTAIKGITDLLPAEATALNQLADKAYVLAQILAATSAFKGQFTSLVDLRAVQDPKAGDLGIVRTTDSDGYAVFTFYQYLNDQWNEYFTLSHHNQKKPATTGTTGDYPYNGMGRIVLEKDVDFKTQIEAVTGGNTIFVICYDFSISSAVNMPENCILYFDGGSISGANINGNKTAIIAAPIKIFGNNVELLGDWNVDNMYVEWFGAVSGGVTGTMAEQIALSEKNFAAFQAAINSAVYTGIPIELLAVTYLLKHGLSWNVANSDTKTLTIKGAGSKQTVLRLPNGELDRLVDAWMAGHNDLPYVLSPCTSDPSKMKITNQIRIYDRWISGGNTGYYPKSIAINGITFDKNAQSNIKDTAWLESNYQPTGYYKETSGGVITGPFDGGVSYNYFAEPSNCLGFYGTYERVIVKDICTKNRYAAGVSFINPAVNNGVVIDGVYDENNDSARFGAREFLYPLIISPDILINNCRGPYVQIETLASQVSGRYCVCSMTNCVIGGLEWNDGTLSEPEKSRLIVANCIIDGYMNISGNYKMKVFDSKVKINTGSTIWNDIEFNNCDFYFPYNEGTVKNITHRGNNAKAKYINCSFVSDALPEGGSGSVFAAITSKTPPMVTFLSCYFDIKLASNSYLFPAYPGGYYRLEKCKINLSASAAIAIVGEYAGGLGKVEFVDNEITNDNVIFVINANVNTDSYGCIKGEYKSSVVTTRASGAQVPNLDGEGLVIVNDNVAIPVYGTFPKNGVIVKNGIRYKVIGTAETNTTIAVNNTNYLAEFVDKFMTTDERTALQNLPALVLEAFDTDLGKPVYWNGSAWVDATGSPLT